MLQALCKNGRLEYDEVLAAFDNHIGHIEDDGFEADKYSAWLNAGSTGNWDWKIQPIRIYSLTNIGVGVPFHREVSE